MEGEHNEKSGFNRDQVVQTQWLSEQFIHLHHEWLKMGLVDMWPVPHWLTHPDVSNVFISHMRTSPWRSVFPTHRSSVFSARPKPGVLPGNSAVSMPFLMPRFTPGVRSMAVWRCLRLSAWSRLRKRAPDSRNCLPKPCWIRRCFRWLLGESADDRPEAGSSGVDVWCDRSVATSCLQAHRFVPVDLPLWGSASGGWCAFIRAHHWAVTGAQAVWLSPHLVVTVPWRASY